jgi:hypothetical protein
VGGFGQVGADHVVQASPSRAARGGEGRGAATSGQMSADTELLQHRGGGRRCPLSVISVMVRAPETTAQAQISSKLTRGYHRPRRERGSDTRWRWARRRPVSCG